MVNEEMFESSRVLDVELLSERGSGTLWTIFGMPDDADTEPAVDVDLRECQGDVDRKMLVEALYANTREAFEGMLDAIDPVTGSYSSLSEKQRKWVEGVLLILRAGKQGMSR